MVCQFYGPTGLAAPLMFSVRALFSKLCRDSQCSINSVLSKERTDRFRRAVREILLTREISFPRQIIFNYSAQLYIFFDMGCVFMLAPMINSIFSTAQQRYWAKQHSPLRSLRWQELFWPPEWNRKSARNCLMSLPLVFIGDSEIIIKMIAKNDHAGPPVFYGTRLMEILSTSSPENWFWCPGSLNPADLLTRSGANCNQINSKFWLHGSFLPQERSTWPTTICTSLPACDTPTRSVNIITTIHVCQSQDLIISLLEHAQSLSKVIKALTFIHKAWRANPATTWNTVKTSISSSVIRCFARATEIIIATNKIKHLMVQHLKGVYYVSDCSFRSCIGVPLICKKTILAKCIVNDSHAELGHVRDVLQILSHIQAKFFIPGVRKMVTNLKKSCPSEGPLL